MNHYPELCKALSINNSLSPSEIGTICQYIKEEKLKRNTHYQRRNSRSGKIGFLVSGVICVSFLNTKDKEQIKYFVEPNQFFTDIDVFFYRKPAGCDLKTVCKCRVLTLTLSDYEMLLQKIPALGHVMNHWSVVMLLHIEQMYKVKCAGNAQARYRHFTRHHPTLARRLPLKYVAMLLQIAPPSLSRLRHSVVAGLIYASTELFACLTEGLTLG
jgi:CRP-like cAMP-binding protein